MARLRLYTFIDRLPNYTCPDIDSAIKIMEDLREKNALLRDIAEKWKEEGENAIDQLEKAELKIEELEQEIEDLQEELEEKSDE